MLITSHLTARMIELGRLAPAFTLGPQAARVAEAFDGLSEVLRTAMGRADAGNKNNRSRASTPSARHITAAGRIAAAAVYGTGVGDGRIRLNT